MAKPAPETFAERGKRIQAAMRNAATGPLVVAREIVGLAGEWDTKWRVEAGDVSADAWVTSLCGRGRSVAWFARRADAVERLSRLGGRIYDVHNFLDHEAAVWSARRARSLTVEQACKWLDDCAAHYVGDNQRVPLTTAQTSAQLAKVVPRKSQTRVHVCVDCVRVATERETEQAAAKKEAGDLHAEIELLREENERLRARPPLRAVK